MDLNCKRKSNSVTDDSEFLSIPKKSMKIKNQADVPNDSSGNEFIEKTNECNLVMNCYKEDIDDEKGCKKRSLDNFKNSDERNNMETIIIKEEIKSEMNDGYASNIDKGNNGDDSIDFEMPECDVEIQLEEGQSIDYILRGSASHMENGSSDGDMNIIKNDGLIFYGNDDMQIQESLLYLKDQNTFENGENVNKFQDMKPEINNKNFTCDLCGMKFVYTYEFMCHIKRSHSFERGYTCPVCDRHFMGSRQISAHMLIHQKDSSASKKFFCSMCNMKFVSADIAKRHLSNHLNREIFNCGFCDKHIVGNIALKKHMLNHRDTDKSHKPQTLTQPINNDDKKQDGELRCDICDRSFSNYGHLSKHTTVHLLVRPFPCEFCHESYVTSKNLQSHIAKRHPHEVKRVLI